MKGNYESLADRTYLQIKKDIFSGKLQPGTRVSELKLAEIYHVSRTPIREAVRKLSEQGLVKCHPRSHMEVVSYGREERDQILELHLHLISFALSKYERSRITALGEKLILTASKAEGSLQVQEVLKYTTGIYHRIIAEASHGMLSALYFRNIEPAFMLFINAIKEDKERVSAYASMVSEAVKLLAAARIAEAEGKFKEAADLLRI